MENEGISEAERLKEEKRRQYEEALEEYNQKCKAVPITELKKWAGSWIVLVLSILVTATAVFTMISLFLSFDEGWFTIIKNLVNLLLSVLACIGFWRSYVMGKSKESNLNLGGPKMLRGVLTFNKVVMYITMVGIIALAVIIFATLKSCADEAAPDTEFNSSLTITLVVLMMIVIAVFAVQIIYYNTITHFADNAINSIQSKSVSLTKCTFAVVFFFIIGTFNLLEVLIPYLAVSSFNKILDEVKKSSELFRNLNISFNMDVPSLLAQLVKAATYIFAGILALKFSNIDQTINSAKQAIEKPIEPKL